jgi:hypothetical protein
MLRCCRDVGPKSPFAPREDPYFRGAKDDDRAPASQRPGIAHSRFGLVCRASLYAVAAPALASPSSPVPARPPAGRMPAAPQRETTTTATTAAPGPAWRRAFSTPAYPRTAAHFHRAVSRHPRHYPETSGYRNDERTNPAPPPGQTLRDKRSRLHFRPFGNKVSWWFGVSIRPLDARAAFGESEQSKARRRPRFSNWPVNVARMARTSLSDIQLPVRCSLAD